MDNKKFKICILLLEGLHRDLRIFLKFRMVNICDNNSKKKNPWSFIPSWNHFHSWSMTRSKILQYRCATKTKLKFIDLLLFMQQTELFVQMVEIFSFVFRLCHLFWQDHLKTSTWCLEVAKQRTLEKRLIYNAKIA